MRTYLGPTLATSLLLLSACSSPDPTEAAATSRRSDEISGPAMQVNATSTSPLGAVPIVIHAVPGGSSATICTGTLVQANKVLTAAHCFDDYEPTAELLTVVFPQNAPQCNGSAPVGCYINANVGFAVANIAKHPTYTSAPDVHDLAVLTLVNPVGVGPFPGPGITVVGQLPLVQLGDASAQTATLPATIVGFGRLQANDGGPAGVRYSGTPSTPTLFKPGCDEVVPGVNLPGSEWCGDGSVYYWRTIRDGLSAAVQNGDSGGPLFATDPASGRPIVIGVASGHYPDFFVTPTTAPTRIIHAATGNIHAPGAEFGVVDNATWLLQNLGPDTDGDGLLDGADNCPGVSNPDQVDADLDGIGDACDNCDPAIMCPGNAALCFNPSQANADGDGMGDVCDGCPMKGQGPTQKLWPDTDGDGVPDTCDNCQGPQNSVATACSLVPCQAGVLCVIPEFPHFVDQERCAIQPDADSDGIGDGCDLCPTVPSTSGHDNTNRAAEESTPGPKPPKLGDECDPTPQMRLRVLTADNGIGVDESNFATEAFLGRDYASAANAAPAASALGGTEFSWCSCVDDSGKALSFEACTIGSQAQCDPATVGAYSRVRVYTGNQILQSEQGSLKPTFEFADLFGTTDVRNLRWDWQLHAANSIPAPKTVPTKSGAPGVKGVMQALTDMPTSVSPRDQSFPWLRRSHGLANGGVFETGEPNVVLEPPPCFGNCFVTLLPWQEIFKTEPAVYAPYGGLRRDAVVLPGAGGKLFASTGRRAGIDIESWLGPDLLAAAQSGARILTPAEPGRLLANRGAAWEVVVLSGGSANPLRFRATDTGFVPVRGGRAPRAVAAAAAPIVPAPPAAYSATEGALYAIRPTGETDLLQAGTIQRYDFETATWGPLAGGYDGVADAIGVALDASRDLFYSLHVRTFLKGKKERLVLVQHDLRRRVSTTVLSVPYLRGSTPRLGLDADGNVLLVKAMPSSFVVFRLSLDGAGKPKKWGVATGKGRVLDNPFLGATEATLAVWDKKDGVRYVPLSQTAFHATGPCADFLGSAFPPLRACWPAAQAAGGAPPSTERGRRVRPAEEGRRGAVARAPVAARREPVARPVRAPRGGLQPAGLGGLETTRPGSSRRLATALERLASRGKRGRTACRRASPHGRAAAPAARGRRPRSWRTTSLARAASLPRARSDPTERPELPGVPSFVGADSGRPWEDLMSRRPSSWTQRRAHSFTPCAGPPLGDRRRRSVGSATPRPPRSRPC